jgi:hypothetical protein
VIGAAYDSVTLELEPQGVRRVLMCELLIDPAAVGEGLLEAIRRARTRVPGVPNGHLPARTCDKSMSEAHLIANRRLMNTVSRYNGVRCGLL